MDTTPEQVRCLCREALPEMVARIKSKLNYLRSGGIVYPNLGLDLVNDHDYCKELLEDAFNLLNVDYLDVFVEREGVCVNLGVKMKTVQT